MLVAVLGGVSVVENGCCRPLIRLDGCVECVRVYEQHLYLFHCNTKCSIRKYKKNGFYIKSWDHEDSTVNPFGRFAILNDIIYVPSKITQTIKCYSLSGEPAGKDIHISIGQSNTGMCATPAGHLVISQLSPSSVVCINPKTGEQLWCRSDLSQPGGITTDNCSHLLVSTGGWGKTISIDVLSADTGERNYNSLL